MLISFQITVVLSLGTAILALIGLSFCSLPQDSAVGADGKTVRSKVCTAQPLS